MGGDLVGHDALAHVGAVRQPQVLLGRDVAEHRRAVPADHRGADRARGEAKAASERAKKGVRRSLLDGVPISWKVAALYHQGLVDYTSTNSHQQQATVMLIPLTQYSAVNRQSSG